MVPMSQVWYARGVRSSVRFTAVLVLTTATARATPWETTRTTVIDPLNKAIHRALPAAIRAHDLTAMLALYATDTGTGVGWTGGHAVDPGAEEETLAWDTAGDPEPIDGRCQQILTLFPTVDSAELRIDRVLWRTADADGYPATVRLIVRGTRADGARAILEQHARLHVAERDGRWLITREEITGRTLVVRRSPRFEDASARAGVTNVHTHEGTPPFRLFGGGSDNPMGASGGSAVADVDGDGFEDLALAGTPDFVLYRNDGHGGFVDVTAESGLPHPYPAVATGVAFLDYDNDGWPDLFVAAIQGGDHLFRNTGGGHFVDVTAPAGIAAGRWGASVAVADYDRDGFLDIYVVRMGDHEHTAPEPNFQARNGVPATLYHNDGNGHFTDRTRAAGVGFTGWGLAAAWGDYDGDGWPDLYVTNEFGGNALYHNQHDGTFRDVAAASHTADGGAGMGVAWGDYDGDGKLDLYVSNMHANSGWALLHPSFPMPIPWQYRLLGMVMPHEVQARAEQYVDRLSRGSTLFHNNGDGTFTDVSDAAGVRDAQWGWATAFLDYDNDGRLDIYTVNGFRTGPILDDV
jgi:hypothetical protein